MNSRGKPLTEFENVQGSASARRSAHTGRDGRASGTRSTARGPISCGSTAATTTSSTTSSCATSTSSSRSASGARAGAPVRSDVPLRPERRAQALFGEHNPRHPEHLAFFFNAFDVWANVPDIQAIFEAFFTTSTSHTADPPLRRLPARQPVLVLLRAVRRIQRPNAQILTRRHTVAVCHADPPDPRDRRQRAASAPTPQPQRGLVLRRVAGREHAEAHRRG